MLPLCHVDLLKLHVGVDILASGSLNTPATSTLPKLLCFARPIFGYPPPPLPPPLSTSARPVAELLPEWDRQGSSLAWLKPPPRSSRVDIPRYSVNTCRDLLPLPGFTPSPKEKDADQGECRRCVRHATQLPEPNFFLATWSAPLSSPPPPLPTFFRRN